MILSVTPETISMLTDNVQAFAEYQERYFGTRDMKHSELEIQAALSKSSETAKETGIDSTALGREAHMLATGVGKSFIDVVHHPVDHLPTLALSAGIGSVLGAASRAGTPGKIVAAGASGAMLAKGVYDEVTGDRWSTMAGAMKDAWQSGDNMERNLEATQNSLGNFVRDLSIGAAGFKVAGKLAGQPNRLSFGPDEDPTAAMLRERFVKINQPHTDTTIIGAVNPFIGYHQTQYRFVPAQTLAVDIRTGNGPYMGLSPDGISRIVADKTGRINHLQLNADITPSELAHVMTVGGLARLAESDPLAWSAAKSSSVFGKIGVISKDAVIDNAVQGSDAFVRGQGGNLYSSYLRQRFGSWSSEHRAWSELTLGHSFSPDSGWNPSFLRSTEILTANGISITPASRAAASHPYIMSQPAWEQGRSVRAVTRHLWQRTVDESDSSSQSPFETFARMRGLVVELSPSDITSLVNWTSPLRRKSPFVMTKH